MSLEAKATSNAQVQFGNPSNFSSPIELEMYENAIDDFKTGYESGWLDHQKDLIEAVRKQVSFTSEKWANSQSEEEEENWRAYSSKLDFVLRLIENPFLLKHLSEEVLASKMIKETESSTSLKSNRF